MPYNEDIEKKDDIDGESLEVKDSELSEIGGGVCIGGVNYRKKRVDKEFNEGDVKVDISF